MYRQNRLLLNINSQELKLAIEKSYLSERTIIESDKKDIEKLFPITFFYKTADDLVEFAHKSIMEFFVAEKLYQQIDCVDSFSSYVEQYILSPVMITNEVLNFLTYFTNRDKNGRKLSIFNNILSEFRNVIYEKKYYITANINYPFETSKVIFKIYWYFIREIIKCDFTDVSALINEEKIKLYITGALSICDSGAISFLDNSAIGCNFSNLKLKEYKFQYCDLSFSNFNRTEFINCEFRFSNLNSTIFRDFYSKERIEFNSCSMHNVQFINPKNNTKQECLFAFYKCDFDNILFKNIDLCKINFQSVEPMNNIKLQNVILTYSQFKLFSKYTTLLKNVTIKLYKSDFSKDNLKKAKEINDVFARRKFLCSLFESKYFHEKSSHEIHFNADAIH